MKEQIESLRKEGKSYKEIAKIVGLSKSTISYYIGERKGREPKKPCKECGKLIKSSKVYCDNDCQQKWLDKRRINNLKEGKLQTNDTIRKALIERDGDNCKVCGISSDWNGKHLTLHVDHIDGNSDNNEAENVRLVCPNCHSQLETTKSKVKKQTRRNKYLRKYKGYKEASLV